MKLTEEQLAEAEAELHRREEADRLEYLRECARKQTEADDRFWAGMCEKYHLDRDTMYEIWAEADDYYR